MTAIPMGQMDVGPMMPGICALTGFVVIPLTFLTWWLLIRRKRRTALVINFTVIFSIAFILWLAGLIDLHYEPSIDDVGAVSAVENIPEVRQFLKKGENSWPPSREALVLTESQDRHEWEVTVGEFDQKGVPTSVWNVFEVSAFTGEVRVLKNPTKHEWLSLEAWRATPH
jgi:hypothetical protein